MQRVLDDMILDTWEKGLSQHPIDRALTLLKLARPDASRDDLADLPIARRDTYLFHLAGHMFGRSLNLIATCTTCAAETALSFDVAEADRIPGPDKDALQLMDGDKIVAFRLPNSRDLARALMTSTRQDARETLLKSLISEDDPTQDLLSKLDQRLQEIAGLEVLTLRHCCSDCGQEQQTAFDIVDYLWRQVVAHANRLMVDIHHLAQAYGWRTEDVLALTPARRAAHVAMVTR